MMNMYAIGDNIRLYARMQNRTLRSIAADINVDYVTFSRWINGRRPITAYGLYKVSKVLRVPMNTLCEGIEST